MVVSLHWGVEYDAQPRAEDVALAHALVEAGALVVLGHHPHVLQPIELHRRPDGRVGVIAYSLGNFVSNQSRNYVHGVTPEKVAATRDGALLRVGLARRDYGRGVVRVEVDGADFVPLWTENDTAEIDREARAGAPPGDPGGRDRPRARGGPRGARALPGSRSRRPDQDRWVALRRRESLLVSRRAAIAALPRRGPAALAPAPPRPPRRSASRGAVTGRACPVSAGCTSGVAGTFSSTSSIPSRCAYSKIRLSR